MLALEAGADVGLEGVAADVGLHGAGSALDAWGTGELLFRSEDDDELGAPPPPPLGGGGITSPLPPLRGGGARHAAELELLGEPSSSGLGFLHTDLHAPLRSLPAEVPAESALEPLDGLDDGPHGLGAAAAAAATGAQQQASTPFSKRRRGEVSTASGGCGRGGQPARVEGPWEWADAPEADSGLKAPSWAKAPELASTGAVAPDGSARQQRSVPCAAGRGREVASPSPSSGAAPVLSPAAAALSRSSLRALRASDVSPSSSAPGAGLASSTPPPAPADWMLRQPATAAGEPCCTAPTGTGAAAAAAVPAPQPPGRGAGSAEPQPTVTASGSQRCSDLARSAATSAAPAGPPPAPRIRPPPPPPKPKPRPLTQLGSAQPQLSLASPATSCNAPLTLTDASLTGALLSRSKLLQVGCFSSRPALSYLFCVPHRNPCLMSGLAAALRADEGSGPERKRASHLRAGGRAGALPSTRRAEGLRRRRACSAAA